MKGEGQRPVMPRPPYRNRIRLRRWPGVPLPQSWESVWPRGRPSASGGVALRGTLQQVLFLSLWYPPPPPSTLGLTAALTITTMPARSASGRPGQAETTAAKSPTEPTWPTDGRASSSLPPNSAGAPAPAATATLPQTGPWALPLNPWTPNRPTRLPEPSRFGGRMGFSAGAGPHLSTAGKDYCRTRQKEHRSAICFRPDSVVYCPYLLICARAIRGLSGHEGFSTLRPYGEGGGGGQSIHSRLRAGKGCSLRARRKRRRDRTRSQGSVLSRPRREPCLAETREICWGWGWPARG